MGVTNKSLHFNQSNRRCTVLQSLKLCKLQIEEKLTKCSILPLNHAFKKIFERNDNLKVCLENINNAKINKPNISSFLHGALWQNKLRSVKSKINIPYFLYFDDLQVNDPLGSHTQSLGAFYYSFPALQNASKLENIYLGGFIKSTDLKDYGNSVTMCYLIDKMNELAKDGILINNIKVHFLLGLVVGDNLGLNGILDFSKSFASNYFCRFCTSHKLETQKQLNEDAENLRNIDNYKRHVANADVSTTGINNESIFNTIEQFHVTHNFSLDFMHLFPEGILHYDLSHILKYYIFNLKLFTLDELNRRKNVFNYGAIEADNMSKDIY